jgi:hypothetical protein
LRNQLAEELPALHLGFSSSLSYLDQPLVLADIIGFLCLASALVRAAGMKLDAVYVITHLIILAVWPYPAEASRFLWVLLPVLFAQPPLLLAQWLKQRPLALPCRSLYGFIGGAVLLMALPGISFALSRYKDAGEIPLKDAQCYLWWYAVDTQDDFVNAGVEAAIVDVLKRSSAVVPEGDCILSPRPDFTAYLSRRRSYLHPLPAVDDAGFESSLRAQACHYALVYLATDRLYPIPMYPAQRLAGYSEVLLKGWLPYAQAEGREPVCKLLRLHLPEHKPADQ